MSAGETVHRESLLANVTPGSIVSAVGFRNLRGCTSSRCTIERDRSGEPRAVRAGVDSTGQRRRSNFLQPVPGRRRRMRQPQRAANGIGGGQHLRRRYDRYARRDLLLSIDGEQLGWRGSALGDRGRHSECAGRTDGPDRCRDQAGGDRLGLECAGRQRRRTAERLQRIPMRGGCLGLRTRVLRVGTLGGRRGLLGPRRHGGHRISLCGRGFSTRLDQLLVEPGDRFDGSTGGSGGAHGLDRTGKGQPGRPLVDSACGTRHSELLHAVPGRRGRVRESCGGTDGPARRHHGRRRHGRDGGRHLLLPGHCEQRGGRESALQQRDCPGSGTWRANEPCGGLDDRHGDRAGLGGSARRWRRAFGRLQRLSLRRHAMRA